MLSPRFRGSEAEISGQSFKLFSSLPQRNFQDGTKLLSLIVMLCSQIRRYEKLR